MATKAWKIYGIPGYNGEWHRQAMSFSPSRSYDFSEDGNVRKIAIENADITGTNEYSVIRITRNTSEECENELMGQLSDGFFENVRFGKVEEIKEDIT